MAGRTNGPEWELITREQNSSVVLRSVFGPDSFMARSFIGPVFAEKNDGWAHYGCAQFFRGGMEIRLAVTRPVICSGTVLAAGFYSTTWPSSQALLLNQICRLRAIRIVQEMLFF
jgi:hypothetical protein